jgi:hypothetical protein
MLARLNKSRRLKAGWCIALAYLFCVLAPSVSFAFADGSRSAPCIIEDHDPGMHVHMHESAIGRDVHDRGAVRDHVHGASMAHEGMTAHEAGLPVKAPQKTTDTRCCGLVTLSAIPAEETALIKPPALTSLCEIEITRGLADNTPPRHYRPPIS